MSKGFILIFAWVLPNLVNAENYSALENGSFTDRAIAIDKNITFKTEEQKKEEKNKKEFTDVQNRVNEIVGKEFWYNSDECITNKIYQDRWDMSDKGAKLDTNNEFIRIKFQSVEINKDYPSQDLIFELFLENGTQAYLKTNIYTNLFKTTYTLEKEKEEPIQCFYVNNPEDKRMENRVTYEVATSSEKWLFRCEKDKFNGSKFCHIYEKDLFIMIYNGRLHVSVGSNHYPRSSNAVKIDNNATIYGYEGDFKNPQNIVNQLKKGKIAYTRYQKWPYQYNIDNELDLDGFTKKYEEMWESYRKL